MESNHIQLNNLLIIGASGHGCVIADLAVNLGYSVRFWDDNAELRAKYPNIEKCNNSLPENTVLILGIGNNFVREKISLKYSRDNYISLIHSSSIISSNVSIGIGSVIMAKVCINNESIIGEHCIINTGAIIEHNCVLSNFVHISPNATLCGNVSIKKGTWVGAGAVIIQGISIGENVIVGAGTVVIHDIPDDATVVGNPGKIIKLEIKV